MTDNTTRDSEFTPENLKKHLLAIAPDGWHLNPPDFKRLRNWNMLFFQLTTAAETLSDLINNPSEPKLHVDFSKRYALFTSFVLEYSKCFSSVGLDQIKLNANDIFKEAKHLRAHHDEILIIRNKMIAHNDTIKYIRVDISVLESDSDYQVRQAIALSLPAKKYEDWLELTRYVERQSNLKFEKALIALQKQLGKTINLNSNV